MVKASKSSPKGAKSKAPAGRGAVPAAGRAKTAAAPKHRGSAAAGKPAPATKVRPKKVDPKSAKATKAPKATKATKATESRGKVAAAPAAKSAPARSTAKPSVAPVSPLRSKTQAVGAGKAEKSRPQESTKTASVNVAKPTPAGRMRDPIAPIDTIRTPAKADDLKARLGRISSVIAQLRALKRTLEHSFFTVGELLAEVQESRLFEVKGYGSLESFLERETDLGSSTGIRALRATTVFQKSAAEAAGFARISAALRALDGEPDAPSVGDRYSSGPVPPHKL